MFDYPYLLWLIPFTWFVLIIVSLAPLAKIPEHILQEKRLMQRRMKKRVLIMIFRGIAISCILIALAHPVLDEQREIPGDPTITLLIDRSDSMELFDLGVVNPLIEELRKEVPVDVKEFNFDTESPIGDFLFNNIKPNSNVLVVSDGQVTSGATIDTLSQVAVSVNSTISVLDLELINEDVAVSISGPAKTVAKIDSEYTVHISRATNDPFKPVDLTVFVDGEEILSEVTKEEKIKFTQNFKEGSHSIIAQIDSEDYKTRNNRFVKTTKVIEQPKILLVTEVPTQLKELLKKLYDVEERGTIPNDLSKYYAVLLHDLPAQSLTNLEALQKYVVEGNGVFFIGGANSFDRSTYKGHPVEQMLPVTVGAYEKKKGDSTIGLAIDISGSSGVKYIYTPGTKILQKVESNALSIEKALAIDVIRNINEGNRVGAVAFTDSAFVVAPVEPLTKNEDELADKISRLIGEGQTDFAVGLGGAYELIKGFSGEKNILMVTDGQTSSRAVEQNTLALSRTLGSLGIKVFIVGVGENSDVEFLQKVAEYGDGLYFAADETNRLNILFGDPEGEELDQTIFDLFILNQFHFITQGLTLDGTMNQFNQVNPKRSAQVLVTLSTGEPALTVWRYGLGRVGSLTTFAGDNNLGELLKDPNSRMLVRATNWHIGDPQRKEDFFIDIPDARVNEPTIISVKTDKVPQGAGLSFEKTDDNLYLAEFTPTLLGLDEILSEPFAVNYEKEYEFVGISQTLKEMALESGGGIFFADQVEEILEVSTSATNKVILKNIPFVWPFALAALVLLFLEMIMRRIMDNWVKT